MKLDFVKKDQLLEIKNDKTLGIQTYGINNDFPQQILMLISSSVSAGQGIDNYSKFINGQGFNDINLWKQIVNRKGQTMDFILRMISEDYAIFGGFCLHFNYNMIYQICEINYVPFEDVRLGSINENGYCDKIKIHWDWTKQFRNLRKWDKKDIVSIDIYNPNPVMIKTQIEQAGGIEKWRGQVLYFTMNGNLEYPICNYVSSLVDMSTEQGLSTIDYRNVRNRFLSGGLLVNKKHGNDNTQENKDKDNYNSEENELEFALKSLQTDDNACKIASITVENNDDVPSWIPMQSNNYDKDYTVTKQSVKERIRTSFKQPPLLFSENVSTGFSTDDMQEAYKFYNNKTLQERYDIERVFIEVFTHWYEENNFMNFSITPLSW